MPDDVLVKRLTNFLQMADTLVKKENLESRIGALSRAYSYTSRKEDFFAWKKDALVHVNKVHPIVRTSVATQYGKRPDIQVKARLPMYEDNATRAELFLNYAARRYDHSRELSLALTSASLFPYGVLKLGVGDGGMPTITYTHPLSFRGDPTMEMFEPEHGRFCAFKYKRSLSALRASGLYEDTVLDDLSAKQMKVGGLSFSEETTPVWLWECYLYETVEGKKKLLLCTLPHEGDTLIREEPFTDVAGLPCRVLQYIPSFDAHYPISPVELFMDQQRELDAIRSNQLIHSDRSQRKMVVRDDAFDQEDLQAWIESAESMAVISTTSQDARSAAALVEQANMSADIYEVERRIVNDIQEIAAVGDAQIGGQPNVGSRTATEASIMESNLHLRSSDRQDIFERFLVSVYTGFLNLAQERLNTDLQIKIMNQVWQPIGRADLAGDFDVDISVGSTMPTDRKSEADKAQALIEMVTTNPVLGHLVNPIQALTYVLQKTGDIRDVTKWISAPPPPPPPGMMPPAGPGGPPPGMGNGVPAGPPGNPQVAANLQALAGFSGNASPLSQASQMRAPFAPPGA